MRLEVSGGQRCRADRWAILLGLRVRVLPVLGSPRRFPKRVATPPQPGPKRRRCEKRLLCVGILRPVSRVSWPGCVFPYKQSKDKGMCDQQRRHDRSRDEERSAQRSGIELHAEKTLVESEQQVG